MKHVILIGASGFVGSAILEELLNRGHHVTAIVRTPNKLTQSHTNLKVEVMDVEDRNALVQVCHGQDAVISAYNPGWGNPEIYEDTLRVYPLILEAVKASGVKRFLVVGGAGSLFVKPGLRLVDTGTLPEIPVQVLFGNINRRARTRLGVLLPCRQPRQFAERRAHGQVPPREGRPDCGREGGQFHLRRRLCHGHGG